MYFIELLVKNNKETFLYLFVLEENTMNFQYTLCSEISFYWIKKAITRVLVG